jgi:hypothetical protein
MTSTLSPEAVPTSEEVPLTSETLPTETPIASSTVVSTMKDPHMAIPDWDQLIVHRMDEEYIPPAQIFGNWTCSDLLSRSQDEDGDVLATACLSNDE